MAQLMVEPVRKILYYTCMSMEILRLQQEGLLVRPEPPTHKLQELKAVLDNEKRKAKGVLMGMASSSKSIATKKVSAKFNLKDLKAKEKRKKMKAAAGDVIAERRKELAKNIEDTAKQYYEDQKNMVTTMYKNQLKQYEDILKEVTDMFTGKGYGRKNIDNRCDDIDMDFDQVIKLTKNLVKHINNMIIKIPMPGAIGMCVTNPGYSIPTALTDLKTIISIIMQIIQLIKGIIKKIKDLFPWFEWKKHLTALAQASKDVMAQAKKVNEGMSDGKKKAESQSTPVYSAKYDKKSKQWYEDNLEGDIVGYKKPNKITTTVTTIEDPVTGDTFDIIDNMEIEAWDMYADKECESLIGVSTDGLILPDGTISSLETASVSRTADGKASVLRLANGRVITIDRIVESGDVVQLNDGTKISID